MPLMPSIRTGASQLVLMLTMALGSVAVADHELATLPEAP